MNTITDTPALAESQAPVDRSYGSGGVSRAIAAAIESSVEAYKAAARNAGREAILAPGFSHFDRYPDSAYVNEICVLVSDLDGGNPWTRLLQDLDDPYRPSPHPLMAAVAGDDVCWVTGRGGSRQLVGPYLFRGVFSVCDQFRGADGAPTALLISEAPSVSEYRDNKRAPEDAIESVLATQGANQAALMRHLSASFLRDAERIELEQAARAGRRVFECERFTNIHKTGEFFIVESFLDGVPEGFAAVSVEANDRIKPGDQWTDGLRTCRCVARAEMLHIRTDPSTGSDTAVLAELVGPARQSDDLVGDGR